MKMDVLSPKCEWENLADTVIYNTPKMLLIGVYSRETFEPIALAGSKNMQVDQTETHTGSSEKFRIIITPNQVKGIANHITTPDNLLTRIQIANMDFLCLCQGTGSMTGMSNFNMDNKPSSIKELDELLFSLTRQHFTRQESFEGFHAFQISSILKEDFIVVSIGMAGNYSSLSILKYLIKAKEEGIVVTKNDSKVSGRTMWDVENANMNKSNASQQALSGIDSMSFETELPCQSYNDKDTNNSISAECAAPVAAVNMRRSIKSDADKKRDQLKRETEFCEDWRTATIRSIEALRMIGPFGEDRANDGDKIPLIGDIGETATIRIEENTDMDPEDKQSTTGKCVRKTSRATLV